MGQYERSQNDSRLIWADNLRAMAIAMAVLCHIVERVFADRDMGYVKSISFAIGRLGVPVFIALTGYFILRKKFSSHEDIIKFYKNNALMLYVSTIIWIIVFNVSLCVMGLIPVEELTIGRFLQEIFFVEQTKYMSQMWYIPLLLCLYLFLPLLSIVVQAFSVKTLKVAGVIVLVVTSLIPSVKYFGNVLFPDVSINPAGQFSQWGGVYSVYAIFGYYLIKENLLERISLKVLSVVFIIANVLSIFAQMFFIENEVEFTLGYDFLPLFVAGMILVELGRRLLNTQQIPLLKSISDFSLGIFFVHYVVIYATKPLMDRSDASSPIKIIVWWLIAFGISYAICFVLSLNKWTKNIFLRR